MTNKHGAFIWYELMTSDPEAAEAFYAEVVGWSAHGFREDMAGYRAFTAGDTDVAGLMALPEEAAANGARPSWLGYIGVDNVDGAVSGILADGGTEIMAPSDIPGVGRFALLADPQGLLFYLMRGESDEPSASFAPEKPGHASWNELETPDPAAALAFYARHFGWTSEDSMPMGEAGDYLFLTHHGAPMGAVMPLMRGGPGAWFFYFSVPDIDAGARAISGNGGTIHHGPAEIPTGDFIVIAADPQGAMFGLSGPRKG